MAELLKEVWRTFDGRYFETQHKADEHEARALLFDALSEVVRSADLYGTNVLTPEGIDRAVSRIARRLLAEGYRKGATPR